MAQPCPACGGRLAGRLEPWLLFCAACGLWRSRLASDQGLQESQAVEESRRVAGLAALRRENYRRTLEALRRLDPLAGKRVLDVGCAYGWFLQAAQDAGMAAVGLEPDPEIAAVARRQGFEVWTGYFPDGVPAGETFDLIAFNDVLEHLPHLGGVLAACARLLRPAGLLVVSAPDSGGTLFRASTLLALLGRKGLLHRLWQKGYPSPHASYFDAANLARLMRRHGFAPRVQQPLRSLRLGGLWQRLHMDRLPTPGSLLSFLALAAALPVLIHLLPSDQLLGIFQVEGKTTGRGSVKVPRTKKSRRRGFETMSKKISVLSLLLVVVSLAGAASARAQNGPYQFHALTPCRIADTRLTHGPALSHMETRNFVVRGHSTCNVPSTAKAATLNVTIVQPNGPGYLTLFPAGTTQPIVSTINYNPFEPALANGAIVPLGAGSPDLAIFAAVPFVSNGQVHVVLDITGYFAAP